MDEYQPIINNSASLFDNIYQKSLSEPQNADFAPINNFSDCQLYETNRTVESLFSPQIYHRELMPSSNHLPSHGKANPLEFYDESVFIDEVLRKTSTESKQFVNNYDDEDDSDDCVITGTTNFHVNNIPSPPTIAQTIGHTPNTLHYKKNENVNTTNTRLDALLSSEYPNVDMQSNFSNYNPEKLPTWNRVFQTFHEPQPYNAEEKWRVTPMQAGFIDTAVENQEYFYDDFSLNPGIIPPNGLITVNEPTKFTVPSVTVPFRDIQPRINNSNLTQPNHISTRIDAANDYQKRTKFQQEMKRKRKIDEKPNRLKGTENSDQKPSTNEVLTGLTWRDGPASYWYDVFNVSLDDNMLQYRFTPTVVSEEHNLSMIKTESLKANDCVFSTWQLVEWEFDIILDSQAAESQVLESNKRYACHAGWIPSSKHRNMAAFQDATCSEYFGIWPASSTGTMMQRPDVTKWHSVFAIENAQMIESDWVTRIITDPRNTNAQEPYLLELDLNNECIHFDFTNAQQTKEILTAELNNVYLTSSSTLPQSTEESTTNDNVDIALVAPPSIIDIMAKEKQAKKMRIFNKFSNIKNHGHKHHHKKIELPANEPIQRLNKYRNNDTYVVVNDQSDHTSLFMDIVNENQAESEFGSAMVAVSPLVRHGIQHSISTSQLDPAFFPLKLDNNLIRQMHRSRFSDVRHTITPLFMTPQPIYNLIELFRIESEQRQSVCQLTGSGDLFCMRSVNDLTASSDHIVLAEYSEECPPLMMQIGMASRVINYIHGHYNQSVIIPQLPYGDLYACPQIPFLGQLSNNYILQSLENNMFRAPIYSHKLKSTDFLVIIKTNTICIRRVNDIFLVGQELPLINVPAPNSKTANSFLKDFLQVQIIRLFLQSQTTPKTVPHDDIKKLFIDQSDWTLKRHLKIFAEYKKDTSNLGGYWILKREFKLPTEEELTELITPEECCAYYSMMWGLCRLEDAGYNSKIFMQADPDQHDDDEEKESNLKIEDEVKAAPWLTTKAFLDAQKGKSYLELTGSTDPTGCGEGFSYARVSTKASVLKENVKNMIIKPKSLFEDSKPIVGHKKLKGTDADLRKLTTKKACSILKECGISEREFKKLKRWDIIDLVRQMSTLKAKQGDEEAMVKFARLSKMTLAGHEERYKSECQRIFNLQNQVLSNEDDLTSDDGISDEEEESQNPFQKSLCGGTADDELELFKMKNGRFDVLSELKRVTDTGEKVKRYSCKATPDNARAILKFKSPVPKAVPKALCIRRQVETSNGSKVTHSQTIPWSTIVKIYFKMNEEHKPDYLKNFCGLNNSKDEEKKARKKLQEKIRRLKRQRKQKLKLEQYNLTPKKKYKPKVLASVQLKAKMNTSEMLGNTCCTACGDKGHIRSCKDCPLYSKSIKKAFNKRPIHGKKKSAKLRHTEFPEPAEFFNVKLPLSSIANNNDGRLSDDDETDHQESGITPLKFSEHIIHQESSIDAIIHQELTRVFIPSTHKELPSNDIICQESTHQVSTVEAIIIQEESNNQEFTKDSTVEERDYHDSAIDVIERWESTIEPIIIQESSWEGLTNDESATETINRQESTVERIIIQESTWEGINHPESTIEPINANEGTINQEPTTTLKYDLPKQLSVQYSEPSSVSTHSEELKNRTKTKTEIIVGAPKRRNSSIGNKKTPILSDTVNATKLAEQMLEQKNRCNRRRIDPRVALNHQFEEIYKGLLEVSGYRCFLHPVRKRECPAYYSIISKPMDLSIVKMKINKNSYESRESFLCDIKLIFDNCVKFNGSSNEFTVIAKQLMSHVMEQFCAKERKLMRLEKLANPLMDDDDMVGLKYVLEQAVNVMEEVEYSRPFHKPVDKKRYPDYHMTISRPMDLLTLRANIDAEKYRSREDFMADANMIVSNCVTYNGADNPLCNVARGMMDAARQVFSEREATFNSLEANLKIQLEDASDSQIAASGSITEEHNDVDEVDGCSAKRPKLNESLSVVSAPNLDANRVRIMADLQLTDSDNDDDEEDLKRSIPIGPNMSGSDEAVIITEVTKELIENIPDFVEETTNNSRCYYQNNCRVDENVDNVTIYISDDD